MSDKIDMSLDDIIKKTKKPGGGRGGRGAGRGGRRGGRGASAGGARGTGGRGRGGARRGGGGAMRRGGGGRQFTSRGGAAEGAWSHDKFDGPRRGGIVTQGGPAKLVVSNLDFGVSDSDIHELFSEFGHLKQASVHYDRSGRSLGTADVIFDRKTDAVKAMKQYNGVPLDGRAMSIQLATSDISVLSPKRAAGIPMKRGFDDRRRSSGRIEKPRRGGRGGARGGGGRGAKRGGAGAKKREPAPSAEDLDKELDSYLKAR